VARDKAALGGACGVAAKTRARLDCGRWVSGGDDRDRRCCARHGCGGLAGALGCFELEWAQAVKGRGPLVPHGPYCTSGVAQLTIQKVF
jgi:hypothetical protein